jgi:hypothetical protein
MFTDVRFSLAGFVVVACLASPSWAATVSVLSEALTEGTAINLVVGDFERVGNCGGGASVINGGCSVVVKDDPKALHAYGRFDPLGDYWIDSQDINEMKWTVTSPQAFTSMTFALTDAHDQLNSFFTMAMQDGGSLTQIWSIPAKKDNANLYWLSVDFGEARKKAVFQFSTKVLPGFDGYGISSLSVQSPAPVPAPPAAILLGSAAMLMASLRRRKKQVR